MRKASTITWKDINVLWRGFCQDLYPNIVSSIDFKEINIIPHENPNIRVGSNIIDWWPNEDISSRIDALNTHGILGAYWKTPTGFIQTAEMFWENRDDLEKIALTWIASCSREIVKCPPCNWKQKDSRIIDEITLTVFEELRNRNMWRWHGKTKYVLPNSLIGKPSLFEKPQNEYDLFQIISLQSVLTYTTWTLVRVSSC